MAPEEDKSKTTEADIDAAQLEEKVRQRRERVLAWQLQKRQQQIEEAARLEALKEPKVI
jgi:hypothetical protein